MNPAKFIGIAFFLVLNLLSSAAVNAQTTYDFNTPATLSYGTGAPYWLNQANITIDGVDYKITSAGNGSLSNSAAGGSGNSKCLQKEGSGGDQFMLSRADNQPFQFYGIWVKQQSMNNYAEFYTLPPWYTITYAKTVGAAETFDDMTPMQGAIKPGVYTTSSTAYSKDLTVRSVSIYFKANANFWIDDIKVGPAVAVVPPAFTAQPANKNVCPGSNITFSVTASNATGYQWKVSTGSGFTNISNGAPYSGATTANLTITGATTAMNGYLYQCVASGTAPVTSNSATLSVPTITTTGSQTNIICNSGSTGSATVVADGGVAPYTYSWSPSGGTGATASALTAGVYTVTVSDANNCKATKTYAIIQPAAFVVTPSQTNVSCNGGSNGTATVGVTGGTGTYTYSWSPSGGTGATASGLAAGKYTVTITDANSCTTAQNFTINQPAAMAVTPSQTNVSCAGGSNGTATVGVTGGTGSYTYSWSPSGGTGATASGLAAGKYTVTITDANSCTTAQNFTINQPAAMAVTPSQTNVSCAGGSNGTATVGVTGGTGTYTYSWSPSGGTGATASGLAAGKYTVTITDANTCTTTQNFSISEPAAMAVTTSQTDVSCNGSDDGSATVDVTGGTGSYTYSWSPSGGTGATATGLAAGKYTVTIADANTCTKTQSFTIAQPAAITATATPASATICSGSATEIVLSSNTSGATFTWTAEAVSGNVTGASAGSGSAIEQTLTGNGVIKYIIAPAKGSCNGAAITVVITVNALTTVESHPVDSNIYDEENTSFSIETTYATSFQWQVDNGNGFTDIQNNAPYSGANTARLTITNATGDLNWSNYRCVASGNCSPVASNSAILVVKTRTVQKISFPATREVTYGDIDFAPDAVSDGGLELIYTSSDETVATIIKGKIHIKKTGQATITASQPGNDDFKPAASVTQQLTINRKDLEVTLNSTPQITKTYDGTTGATLIAGNYTIAGLVGSDDVTVAGTAYYNDSKAGSEKTITVNKLSLSGEDINNYNLTTTTSDVKGDITKKDITVTLNATPLISKTYDATTEAQLAADNYSLIGLIGKDETGITGNAAYSDKNAGSDKIISVSDFVLNGEDKDNYSLTTSLATTTGDIEAKPIGIVLSSASAITKVYDGATQATTAAGNYLLQNVEKGDNLSVTGTAEYDNPNAGTGKTVTISQFVLSGTDKDNYSLKSSSDVTTGSITQKVLSVTLQQTPVVTKVYDGNTDAVLSAGNYLVTGIVGSDDVVLNNPATGTYDSKNGGLNKQLTVTGLEISGGHAGNYSLASTTAEAAIGIITPKEIKVVADAQTKRYGNKDPEFTYKTEGKLEQDELTGSLERATGKNVGDYAITIGSVSGGDNYNVSEFEPSVLSITPAPLVITAEDKTRQQGTVNPSFTFSYEGLVAGDAPSDLSIPAVATATAVTGSPIGYYDIVAAGAVSNNYTITFINGKLTVTPAGGPTHSLKTWSSSPDVLQIRIYTDVAQKAAIILYTENGQQVVLQQHQLQKGINSFSMPVGHLSSSTYILGVAAEKFKDSQKVNVK